MSPTPAELRHADPNPIRDERWSFARFWAVVLLVFGLQVFFVFWLGARSNPMAGKMAPAPVIQLSSSTSNELIALNDPTIFALPHDENFSGAAWLKRPHLTFQPSDWTEPPKPLRLDMATLGATFKRFMLTNTFQPSEVFFPAVRESFAAAPDAFQPIAKPSALRLEGEIASRQLLSSVDLPPLTNSDLLPATEVQLLVNAQGRVLSSVILRGSGNAEADQFALAHAKHARFDALKSGSGTSSHSLSFGKMVFEWQTVPLPSTNGTSVSSSP